MKRSNMNIDKWLKRAIVAALTTVCIALLCLWGYWEYLGYKMEKNPLFYYKECEFCKGIREMHLSEKDSIVNDSIIVEQICDD